MKTKLLLFLTLVLIGFVQISAQDVIFKRNGELVNAKNSESNRIRYILSLL